MTAHQLTLIGSETGGSNKAHGQVGFGSTKNKSFTTPCVAPATLHTHPLTSAERDAHLESLKVFGRDPANADPIFTKQASHTILQPPCKANFNQGNRSSDPTCLQQPFTKDLAKCSAMPGECDAPQSRNETNVCGFGIRIEGL
jgi:hypothetical protein